MILACRPSPCFLIDTLVTLCAFGMNVLKLSNVIRLRQELWRTTLGRLHPAAVVSTPTYLKGGSGGYDAAHINHMHVAKQA